MRKILNRVLVLEGLSPALFLLLWMTFNGHWGTWSVMMTISLFIVNLAIMLLFGLPYWILLLVGTALRTTCFCLLSLVSLGMCLYALSVYYTVFQTESKAPPGTGEAAFVFIIIAFDQLKFVLPFCIMLLVLNWILKRLMPSLP